MTNRLHNSERSRQLRLMLATVLSTVIFGCATPQLEKRPNATTSARLSATPDAPPRKTITNFTESLRCMDDKLASYEVSDFLIGAQEVHNIDSDVSGTKDMLMTALSTMTRKSKAFRIVTLSQDLADVTAFHTYHTDKTFKAPDFFVRLSTPQIDKGIQFDQVGGGLRLEGIVDAEHSRDRMASMVSMDMNLGVVKNLQLLPGVYSSNSIAVVRTGRATDLAGEIKKFGAVFHVATDESEGFHHSVRTLIELGAIEIVGRLTQIPYWECLDINATHPLVQEQINDWYESLSQVELLTFIQGKLAAMGLYRGKINGTHNTLLSASISRYQAQQGLVADGRLNALLYFSLLNDPTRAGTQHLTVLARKTNQSAIIKVANKKNVADAFQPAEFFDKKENELSLELRSDRGTESAVYKEGESIRVTVTTSIDAYVFCYYQQGDGSVLKIFPNRFQPSGQLSAGTSMNLPENNQFQILADMTGSTEQIMCMAAYDNIDASLPFELNEKDLQALPVNNLDQIYSYYKSAATILPIRKTITLEVY